MMIGSDTVVMSIDDAKLIVEAASTDWSPARIAYLQHRGLLDAVNRLRDVVRAYENKDKAYWND